MVRVDDQCSVPKSTGCQDDAPVGSNARAGKHLSDRLCRNPDFIHGIASTHMVWAQAVSLKHSAPYSDCLPRLELCGGAFVGALPPTGDRPGTCMLHRLTIVLYNVRCLGVHLFDLLATNLDE